MVLAVVTKYKMNCCICYEEWTDTEYNELSYDEKQQCNKCKICKSFVCIMCRDKYNNINKVKSFECPICKNMDWKHYYSEEILWFIKNNGFDINFMDDNLIGVYYKKGIYPPPIYKYYNDK